MTVLPKAPDTPASSEFVRDARITAAVVAAPGLGFTFVPTGLSKVTVPVQVWSGDAEGMCPTRQTPVRCFKRSGRGRSSAPFRAQAIFRFWFLAVYRVRLSFVEMPPDLIAGHSILK